MYWLMMLMLFTPLHPFDLSCDLHGDLVIRPLTLKINRALYSAKLRLCMKFCEAMSKHSWGKCDNFT